MMRINPRNITYMSAVIFCMPPGQVRDLRLDLERKPS